MNKMININFKTQFPESLSDSYDTVSIGPVTYVNDKGSEL